MTLLINKSTRNCDYSLSTHINAMLKYFIKLHKK
jgi:hypothetical protein